MTVLIGILCLGAVAESIWITARGYKRTRRTAQVRKVLEV